MPCMRLVMGRVMPWRYPRDVGQAAPWSERAPSRRRRLSAGAPNVPRGVRLSYGRRGAPPATGRLQSSLLVDVRAGMGRQAAFDPAGGCAARLVDAALSSKAEREPRRATV